MTGGLSAPDAALVHGFRGSEEDGGEADNPETDRQEQTVIQWPSPHAHAAFIMCN